MLAGILLVYTGLRNITLADYLRSVIKLGPLPGPASGGLSAAQKQATEEAHSLESGGTLHAAGGATTTGQAVAQAALGFVGKVPYIWAGESPNGWDCSGMVTYILHTMFGLELPSNVHTTSQRFYVWSGAATVTDPQPGDLACWVTHIGIMVDGGHMVSAVNPMNGTRLDSLSTWPPAVYRRPLAYGAAIGAAPVQEKVG
jgi:cell wall-associated NlpC family hydrolase